MEDLELDGCLKEKWQKFCVSDLLESYQKIEKESENFEVLDSDVWICGYPRTGSTWLLEMVWLLLNNCDFENAKINLHDRCTLLETTLYCDYATGGSNQARKQKTPRCIRSHLPFHLLPKQLRNREKHPKIIYVTRNPLDVCVSYFHYLHPKGSLDEFSRLFLKGKILPGDFADHVLSFWRRKHLFHILFIRYEDMQKDLRDAVQETAAFLSTPIPARDMDKLLNHLSFESMKNNPAVRYDELYPETKLLRVGEVGHYRTQMTSEAIETFQKWIDEKFTGSGLSF